MNFSSCFISTYRSVTVKFNTTDEMNINNNAQPLTVEALQAETVVHFLTLPFVWPLPWMWRGLISIHKRAHRLQGFPGRQLLPKGCHGKVNERWTPWLSQVERNLLGYSHNLHTGFEDVEVSRFTNKGVWHPQSPTYTQRLYGAVLEDMAKGDYQHLPPTMSLHLLKTTFLPGLYAKRYFCWYAWKCEFAFTAPWILHGSCLANFGFLVQTILLTNPCYNIGV